jgi:hypothetical protein
MFVQLKIAFEVRSKFAETKEMVRFRAQPLSAFEDGLKL